MPSPSAQLASLDPALSTFYQYAYEESEKWFVGHKLLPITPVRLQSSSFGIVPLEEMLKHDQDGKRASGTGYKRSQMEFMDATYATREYGLEEVIDDREAKVYQNFFEHSTVMTRRLINRQLTNAEKRIQARVMSLSQYGARVGGPTVQWSDHANAKPVTDVEVARKAFRDTFGLIPNLMVINYEVYRNLRQVVAVKEDIKSSGAGDPAKVSDVTLSMLQQVFDINIAIGGSMENTAAGNLPASLADIWTDDVLITKVATSPDLAEPALGRTLHWAADGSRIDGHVERYRDEAVRGDIIRDRHEVDEKIFYDGFGYVITNTLA